MFATLLGALPRPPDEEDVDRSIEVAVRAQEDAGLEPITDGRLAGPGFDRLPTPDEAVERWRATASLTARAVKQALPGPRALGEGNATADALAEVASALAEAGCPLIEIEESAIDRLADADERRLFGEAHDRLLARAPGMHLSLSIVGGAPDPAAWPTILELPYASLAVDLIAGPDNWNLVTRWAGDLGVIAGAESSRQRDEPKELLLWAAQYAAATSGRGLNRVGLGSAGSWANLTWESAVRKMGILGEAARLASMPPSRERALSIDPKAGGLRRVGPRSAGPRRARPNRDV